VEPFGRTSLLRRDDGRGEPVSELHPETDAERAIAKLEHAKDEIETAIQALKKGIRLDTVTQAVRDASHALAGVVCTDLPRMRAALKYNAS